MLAAGVSAHQLMNKISDNKQKAPAPANPNTLPSGIQKKP